jgi:hypothetical protein
MEYLEFIEELEKLPQTPQIKSLIDKYQNKADTIDQQMFEDYHGEK